MTRKVCWISSLSSHPSIFQLNLWRQLDVQAVWRRTYTYGRAPKPMAFHRVLLRCPSSIDTYHFVGSLKTGPLYVTKGFELTAHGWSVCCKPRQRRQRLNPSVPKESTTLSAIYDMDRHAENLFFKSLIGIKMTSRLFTICMTLIPSSTITESRLFSKDHLQRVWHGSRECLPFATHSFVSFWTYKCSDCWQQFSQTSRDFHAIPLRIYHDSFSILLSTIQI